MLETLSKYTMTVPVCIYCQICHRSPRSSDVVEMFIKLEVNCTEKLMTSILDETAHHRIQIIGPPTLPTVAFLMFCVGKFQPGTSYTESAKAAQGHQEAVAGGNEQAPPSASPSAWPMTAASNVISPVCLVPQVSSVFCQPHNRYHKRVTLGHTLIQPLAWSLVQKPYKQCVVGSA